MVSILAGCTRRTSLALRAPVLRRRVSHSDTHTHTHTHTHPCIYVHVHTHVHAHTHTHTHTCTCTHTHTHVHVYVHTHMYTRTHTHTHVHANTHTQCSEDYNSRQSVIRRARTPSDRSLLLRADIVTERKRRGVRVEIILGVARRGANYKLAG